MGAQWKAKGKSENAAAKGKIFSKLAKEIMIAARGGPDPAMNARLRAAVESAKKASMPRDNIERSIKKGAGLTDDTVTFETVTYEGFAPHRVPVIVECLTDNKNRTATTVRVLFRKGQLGTTGSVSWDFGHVGLVDATPAAGADPEEAAIDAGAQDYEADGEGGFRFYTEPTDLDAVSKALSALGWTVATMRLGWRAKHPVKVDDPAGRAEVEAFLAGLDEDDDVQHIYAAFEHDAG
ncbi:MAG: YebC/PmpR family DNA-binding transcriptional regulator [Deltaproteobacteria bacterium]|nr:YebC/PmpR family DNA-binding transcriptional regulator [Deltaproteobacteria bacterium]